MVAAACSIPWPNSPTSGAYLRDPGPNSCEFSYRVGNRMRTLHFSRGCLLVAIVMGAPASAIAQPFGPNTAKEPIAEKFSLGRAVAFLDHVALQWNTRRKCA